MVVWSMIHTPQTNAEGLAALGICESLVIALTDLQVLSEEEARGLLTDVVDTHADKAATSTDPARHQAVVDIIRRILAGKNGAH